MRVISNLSELERGSPAIITIGAFDGVHRGHQYLIRQVVTRARSCNADSVVLTFDPRPQVVLSPGNVQLTNGDEKARVIRALGVDTLAVLPFTAETALVPAGQFLASILDHINLSEIWIGADFAFGHKRSGNPDFLIRAGAKSGFGVHVVARQGLGGETVSSTRARELVAEGHVAEAARLLGHYASVSGTIVRGAGRGADLGYPTANFSLVHGQLVPGIGIYAGYMRWNGERKPAAISVGFNVVFGGQSLSVEAYALDFDGDLRGTHMHLDFVERLRGEENFESVDALVQQMHRDVARVREILDAAEEPGELLLSV